MWSQPSLDLSSYILGMNNWPVSCNVALTFESLDKPFGMKTLASPFEALILDSWLKIMTSCLEHVNWNQDDGVASEEIITVVSSIS